MLVERAMHRYVVQSLEADWLSGTRFWRTICAGSRWGIAVRTVDTRIAIIMIHRKGFNGILWKRCKAPGPLSGRAGWRR